jgi:REP element-mobilizing transposase RayT
MLIGGHIYHRRSIRLPEHDYSSPGIYFITICLQDRACLLGGVAAGTIRLSESGIIAENCWQAIPGRFPGTRLDDYVIMPNHVHGIIVMKGNGDHAGVIHGLSPRMRRRTMMLPKIIGHFKMNTAKRINQMRRMPGRAVWQRNYYEHVVRNDMALNKIREYIRNNPRHWSSDVENPEYSGNPITGHYKGVVH